MGNPFCSCSVLIRFSATTSPVRLSWATKTLPYVPCPTWCFFANASTSRITTGALMDRLPRRLRFANGGRVSEAGRFSRTPTPIPADDTAGGVGRADGVANLPAGKGGRGGGRGGVAGLAPGPAAGGGGGRGGDFRATLPEGFGGGGGAPLGGGGGGGFGRLAALGGPGGGGGPAGRCPAGDGVGRTIVDALAMFVVVTGVVSAVAFSPSGDFISPSDGNTTTNNKTVCENSVSTFFFSLLFGVLAFDNLSSSKSKVHNAQQTFRQNKTITNTKAPVVVFGCCFVQ